MTVHTSRVKLLPQEIISVTLKKKKNAFDEYPALGHV